MIDVDVSTAAIWSDCVSDDEDRDEVQPLLLFAGSIMGCGQMGREESGGRYVLVFNGAEKKLHLVLVGTQ